MHYWALIARKAEARGVEVSRILTDEAQYVDLDGNVWAGFPGAPGARLLGHTSRCRDGWAGWGLETAGPPWIPPPSPKSPPKPRAG